MLPDLEAIKCVMFEKQSEKLKQKVRLLQAGLKPRVIQKARCLGAQLVESL